MIKFGFVKYFAVAIAFIFVSCEESTTQAVRETMLVVDASADIPECQSGNEGELVFVKDEAATLVCSDGEWIDQSKQEKDTVYVKEGSKKIYVSGKLSCETVSLPDDSGIKIICNGDSIGVVLNGRDGDDGVDGANGRNGKDGKDGTDGKSAAGENGGDGKNGVDGVDGVGCSVRDMDSIVVVVCGEDSVGIYKEACGVKPYDPETHFCDYRDNRIYRYVTIGNQIWMAENLNYEVDSNYHCYMDSCEKYGKLYTWATAMDSLAMFSDEGRGCGSGGMCAPVSPVRGICPEGWHLPDSLEWVALYNIKKRSPYALQAIGYESWKSAEDSFGFSALPAPFYCKDRFVGYASDFWTINQVDTLYAYHLYVYENAVGVDRRVSKACYLSIRCLKDY